MALPASQGVDDGDDAGTGNPVIDRAARAHASDEGGERFKGLHVFDSRYSNLYHPQNEYFQLYDALIDDRLKEYKFDNPTRYKNLYYHTTTKEFQILDVKEAFGGAVVEEDDDNNDDDDDDDDEVELDDDPWAGNRLLPAVSVLLRKGDLERKPFFRNYGFRAPKYREELVLDGVFPVHTLDYGSRRISQYPGYTPYSLHDGTPIGNHLLYAGPVCWIQDREPANADNPANGPYNERLGTKDRDLPPFVLGGYIFGQDVFALDVDPSKGPGKGRYLLAKVVGRKRRDLEKEPERA